MFESLEIRKAANGFILVVHTEDDTKEYVYDTERKLMRSVKQYLGQKVTADDQD
jgi:dihydroorotase